MILWLLLCLAAHAVPGLMLGHGPIQPLSPAVQVLLVRDGARTVVAIQPSYIGPGQDFVWMLPVPAGVRRDQIVANGYLAELFRHLDHVTAPRLVGLEQRDPCPPPPSGQPAFLGGRESHPAAMPPQGEGLRIAWRRWWYFQERREDRREVARRVAAKAREMASSEYQLHLLSGQGSAVARWLRRHGYPVNQRVRDFLTWQVPPDHQVLIAQVAMEDVAYERDHYALRPVMYVVEDETFQTNVSRNLSSAETARWTLYVVGPSRYEVAERPNVVVPTNLSVRASAGLAFDALYRGLVRRARGERSDTVITEWAGHRGPCDRRSMGTFSLDWLSKAAGADLWTAPSSSAPLTLTRLSLLALRPRETLTFEPAPAIEAGLADLDPSGQISTAVTPSAENHVRARYVVLRPWPTPSACEAPRTLWVPAAVNASSSAVYARSTLHQLYPPGASDEELEDLLLSPLP